MNKLSKVLMLTTFMVGGMIILEEPLMQHRAENNENPVLDDKDQDKTNNNQNSLEN